MKETIYTLSMNTKQAKLLVTACEFYCRMMLGQWNELSWHTLNLKDGNFDKRIQDKDEVDKLLMQARALTWPDLGNYSGRSWGVGHDKNTDIVWEIYEVLRNKIAWKEHPEGGDTVDFSTPISFSGEKLVDCKVEVKNEN